MMQSRKFLVKCILTFSYSKAFCRPRDRNIHMLKIRIHSSTKDMHIFLRYFFLRGLL